MAEKKSKKTKATAENRLGASKRLFAAKKEVEALKVYSLTDAIALVKKTATAKFDESVDIAISLGIDAKQTDQAVRGVVGLPNGIGKELKVAAFAKGAKAEEAKKAGAFVVGAEDLIEIVAKGTVDFERCVATPDMMPLLGKVAKVLGPKGLMPNPKLGSVTENIAEAVKSAKSGQVEFRAEKAGIVHAIVGKTSFDAKKLEENIVAFVGALNKAKPTGTKGIYLKKITLSSTMGPGVRVASETIAA
jgi:large subunit ribosomal protein L1